MLSLFKRKNFINVLKDWLKKKDILFNTRSFYPHVSVSRNPFLIKEWKHHFKKIPVIFTEVNLYKSEENLVYNKIWSHKLLPPFEEIDHTADFAFNIYGSNFKQILLNAQIALSFKFNLFLKYLNNKYTPSSLDDIIIFLNDIITKMDLNEGCPVKAVSFHGDIKEEKNNILKWRMIIDV